MAKVKAKVKVKDKVECRSCKCFNVKRKDVNGRARVHKIIQYEATLLGSAVLAAGAVALFF
jgi:hypothetical protein